MHACARAHGAQFCGVCPEFPCEKIHEMIPWNANIVEHLRDVLRQLDSSAQ
ncbi:MAG: DUF3795 domain-containing protein [Clostridia bacterium]|nr:DUF3795 domain-containing protein [Clostridia bacterium]